MFLFISEIKEGTVRITNVRIICQLCDQITDTFCRCFVTGRFVTFTRVLINEHPAASSSDSSLRTDKIRPDFDILSTLFNLQLSINGMTRFNGINFPLIVQHFDECFGQELWFGLSDGHRLSGVHTIGTL